jgi:hypothetical protein
MLRTCARVPRARARAARAKQSTSLHHYTTIILVDLGDFGQIPGPSSVLFRRVLRVLLLLLRFCVIILYCALN